MWITGIPRIGKSVFLCYVAERLREENIDFVITIQSTWYNSKYEQQDCSLLKGHLQKSVVHLIDPEGKPVPFLDQHEAFAVFFASPTITNIEPYHKKNLVCLFMPLWTRDEMQRCCDTLQLEFDAKIFEKWGGVFIDCFRAATLESQLDEVLESSNLRDILSNLHSDSLSESIKQNQWLLHRHPYGDYRKYEVQLPSFYVEEKVVAVLDKVKFQDVMQSNSSILGKLYEQHALKNLLISEKVLNVTPYDRRGTNDGQQLEIKAVKHYSNASVESETPDKNTLYRPNEKNKQGVDAVLVTTTNTAFPLTISHCTNGHIHTNGTNT